LHDFEVFHTQFHKRFCPRRCKTSLFQAGLRQYEAGLFAVAIRTNEYSFVFYLRGVSNLMKRLFLASFFKGAAKAFPEFAGGDLSGKKVCFIPTASLPEKVTFYVGADMKALRTLGLIVENLEITQNPIDVIQDRIRQSDYIFVSGGNTFFLLQELRRTGADKLITEHINSGKVYIGASAGSMILSGNIEYARHMDSPAGAPDLNGDFTALSITAFSVVPHATNAPFRKAAEKIIAAYGDSLDLRPISNNQAIAVTGDDIQIITV
jgi:dipeptidase E